MYIYKQLTTVSRWEPRIVYLASPLMATSAAAFILCQFSKSLETYLTINGRPLLTASISFSYFATLSPFIGI